MANAKLLFFVLILTGCSTSFYQLNTEDQNKNYFLGYVIADQNGTILESMNADHYFIPASLNKLLLYPYWSQLKYDSLFWGVFSKYDSISTTLQLILPGNPLFNSFHLDQIKNQFSHKSINKLHILHLNYDPNEFWGAGWMYDDDGYPFQSRLTPIPFNQNVNTINVSYSDSVHISQYPFEVPVIYQMGPTHIQRKLNSDTVVVNINNLNNEKIVVSKQIALYDPYSQLFKYLRKEFNTDTILVDQMSISMDKKGFRFTSLIHYHQLSQDILYNSSNLSTEQSVRYLSILNGDSIGNFSGFYHGFGIDSIYKELVDASGLSRYNLIKVKDIYTILGQYKHENNLRNELPVYGYDGNLSTRKPFSDEFKIRAKSGSMRHIQNLAGYIYKEDKLLGFFVFMLNNSTLGSKALKDLEYEFIEYSIQKLDNQR